MIVTARHLEDLHRQNGGNGHVTLPYRARLTPLASDWIRSKKIVVGYSDLSAHSAGKGTEGVAKPEAAGPGSVVPGAILWWCDGPCGAAKAAIAAHERESNLRPLDKAADATQLVTVIKTIASDVKSGRAGGAILLVQNGAQATVFANRCPSIRAVVGTSMDAVEQGVRQVAANVLIVEYPGKTLQQVRNLLSRFTRAKHALSEDVRRQLQELASCG